MKLSPSKLQLGRKVNYGGVVIEVAKAVWDISEGVFISPTEDKLHTFLNISVARSLSERKVAGTFLSRCVAFSPRHTAGQENSDSCFVPTTWQ